MSASMKKSRVALRIIVALVIDIGATIIAVLVTPMPGLRDTVNGQSGSHLLLACVAALFICGTATLSTYGGYHLSSLLLFFMSIEESPQKWVLVGSLWLLIGVTINWRYKVLENLA